MIDRSRQPVYLYVLLVALAISVFVIRTQFNIQNVGAILFFLVFIPTLIRPGIGFMVIIVSALFSPDIIIGVTTRREITIRVEDIFLLVVLFAWLLRAAFTKDLLKIFKASLTAPFFIYIGVCVLSSVFAALSGDFDIGYGFFSILKYLEYFMLFLVARNTVTSFGEVKLLTVIFIITALLVSVNSNIYIAQQLERGVGFFRTAPPVETRGGGEAGTLGGYLLFMIAVTMGCILCMRPLLVRLALILVAAVMFRPFLYTMSRGSYIAFIPMLMVLVLFSRKMNFLYVTIIGLILLGVFMPPMVRGRITQTVAVKEDVEGRYVEWEESPRFRLESWREVAFDRFPRSPFFGYGVGRFFIDSQLFLTLSETGLLGLVSFGWILTRLFLAARRVFYDDSIRGNDLARGLSLGFLAGFSGLLVQAVSTNTFIIIRIMEPFWIMAAIVVALPALVQKEAAAQDGITPLESQSFT